jgi:hypothetical protein
MGRTPPAPARGPRSRRQATKPIAVASATNGAAGRPGTIASRSSNPAAIAIAFGWAVTCNPMSRPRCPPSSSDATRVTMMPAAVEITSAGI